MENRKIWRIEKYGEQKNMENRKKILCSMLKLRRSITFAYHKYMSTAREYYPGELLYMREAHVIKEIGANGLDNVSTLGERLKITKGAVSQYLSKLEKKGFIQRIQDVRDKRQYSVILTDKGLELYYTHVRYDQENYEKANRLFDEFSEEELLIVQRFDQKFAEFVDGMTSIENIVKK